MTSLEVYIVSITLIGMLERLDKMNDMHPFLMNFVIFKHSWEYENTAAENCIDIEAGLA